MRSIRSLTVLAFTAALALPAAAEAQSGWRSVYRDQRLTVALDTGRVVRESRAGEYTVVMRWNYASPRLSERRREYTRMIQQVRVRCTPAPIVVKRFSHALYAENGTLVEEARPLTGGELRNMAFEPLPRRSEGSRVYPGLCRTLSSSGRGAG